MSFRKNTSTNKLSAFALASLLAAGTGRLWRRRRWRRRPNHGYPARHNAQPATTQGDRTREQSTSCPIPFSR